MLTTLLAVKVDIGVIRAGGNPARPTPDLLLDEH